MFAAGPDRSNGRFTRLLQLLGQMERLKLERESAARGEQFQCELDSLQHNVCVQLTFVQFMNRPL